MQEIQVGKEHYDFKKYVTSERWQSYYYQVLYSLEDDFEDILLIGIGDNLVGSILKQNQKQVVTFDFDVNLKPDILGDVIEIDKIVKKKYDCVLCCQVLEHISYEEFESIIEKLSLITKKRLILSLPYNSSISLLLKANYKGICKTKKIIFKKFWKRKKFKFEEEGKKEHYWEVNVLNCKLKNIIHILKKYFKLEEYFMPDYNLYHVFFILYSKN